jgi:hypothetical protein
MRVPRVALTVVVGSLVAGSVGVGVVFAPSASAVATVTTTQINCGTSAASATVTVPTALAVGDTLVVSYTDCNNYNLTRSNFAENSVYNVNGASAQTQTLTVYAGATTAGTTLATLTGTSGGTAKTITIVQAAADPWTAKTPGSGTVGTAYTYTFAATGATATSYALGSGTLPTGLSLANTGALTGTPTATGSFTFAVTATVSSTVSTGNVTVVVSGGPAITKVTICHRTRATTNPYVLITVSVNSVIGSGGGNGHSDHNTTRTNLVNPTTNGITPGSGPFDTAFNTSPGYSPNQKWWGDIIPPFSYTSGGSTLTYAGLNWGPSSGTTWAWPNPTTTAPTDWLQASEFATAVNAAPSSTYKDAVSQCMDLSAAGAQSTKSAQMDTPAKYFNVSVNNGEDPSSIESDLSEQQALNSGGTVDPIPSLATLESGLLVQTVAASGTSQTASNLNGTLGTTVTWTSWRFQWATSIDLVRAGSGSTYTYTPAVDPVGSVGAGPTSPTHPVTGLTCGTTYYFRVVGIDSVPATTYGDFKSFSTSACSSGGGGSSSGSSSSGGGGSSTPTATPSSGATTSPGVGPVKKPETEKVKPGKDVTLIDGEPTPTEKKKDGKSTKVEISGPEFKVEVGGTTSAGKPLPLTPAGAPIVAPREKVATSGDGYAPGSTIELYILDPLTSLGSIPVNPDGTFSGSITVPSALPPGEYVIQMNGYTPTSQVRSVSVGMTVRSAALVLCAEGTSAKATSDCPGLAQRPKSGIILPKELFGGRNLLLPTRIRMNSGQFADAKVLCSPATRSAPKGDIAYCETTRVGKKTYVLVRPNMRLNARVVISAPPTSKYAAYTSTKRYTIG